MCTYVYVYAYVGIIFFLILWLFHYIGLVAKTNKYIFSNSVKILFEYVHKYIMHN